MNVCLGVEMFVGMYLFESGIFYIIGCVGFIVFIEILFGSIKVNEYGVFCILLYKNVIGFNVMMKYIMVVNYF